jgi:hypothetical protein
MSFFISYPLSALGHISSLLPVGFWADKGYEMKNAMCNNLYVYILIIERGKIDTPSHTNTWPLSFLAETWYDHFNKL